MEGTGLVNGNIANSSIRWEETTKAKFGLDLGLFNERVSVNFDYFNNQTEGLLNLNDSNPIYGSEGFFNKNPGSAKMIKTDPIERPLALITIGDPAPEVQKIIDFFRGEGKKYFE